MPSQQSAPTRSLIDFFSCALSSFQSSGSKFQVICTAASSFQYSGPGKGSISQKLLIDDRQQAPTPVPPRVQPRTLIVLDSSFNPPTRAHMHMATSTIYDLMAKDPSKALSNSRLLLLLSVNNADKAPKPAAFDKRLAMMWAFAWDFQRAMRQEQRRVDGTGPTSGVSIDVDLGLCTLPYFHAKSAAIAESTFYSGKYGEKHDEGKDNTETMEQIFLVGYDTLIRIFNPKYYGPVETIAQLTTVGQSPMQKALGPFFARSRLRVTMRTDDEWGGMEEQIAYVEDLMKEDGLLQKVGGARDWVNRIDMVEGLKAGTDVISSTYARAAAKYQDANKLDLMVTPEVRWWIEHESLYQE